MSRHVTGKTKLFGVIGTPIEHSSSPKMHNAAFDALDLDYEYLAFEVGQDTLAQAVEGLKVLGVKGFSVTMPNKQVVAPYLDELSKEARLCGSVNCVHNENGKLIGYNTDGHGFVETLRNNGVKIEGAKMTLIGTGGVSAAACTQAALDGMREISLFGIKDATFEAGLKLAERLNRETNCKVRVYELTEENVLREQVAQSDILGNATPVGMGRMEGKSPVNDLAVFRPGLSVIDVIYHPAKTKFLEMAESCGCKIMNGKQMLLYQGAKSFSIWTGKEMPLDVVAPIVEQHQ